MASDCETYKIIIVGPSGVGKTAILMRYVDNVYYASNTSTIGIDGKVKELNYHGRNIKVYIEDTAGQEHFRAIVRQFYRDADGVVLIYDVSDRRSFQQVLLNLEDCVSYCHKEQFAKILVANKIDCKVHEVKFVEGRTFARNNGMLFVETSARTSENIEDIFLRLIEKILRTPSLTKHRPAVDKSNTAAGVRQEVSNAAGSRNRNTNTTQNKNQGRSPAPAQRRRTNTVRVSDNNIQQPIVVNNNSFWCCVIL